MITAQEIFDRTVRHLIQQDGPSVAQPEGYRGVLCAYRGDNGRACAVGYWIPDEKYTLALEGNSLRSYVTDGAYDWCETVVSALPPGFREHLPLLERLQQAHDAQMSTLMDTYVDRKNMYRTLREIAEEFGLSDKEVPA